MSLCSAYFYQILIFTNLFMHNFVLLELACLLNKHKLKLKFSLFINREIKTVFFFFGGYQAKRKLIIYDRISNSYWWAVCPIVHYLFLSLHCTSISLYDVIPHSSQSQEARPQHILIWFSGWLVHVYLLCHHHHWQGFKQLARTFLTIKYICYINFHLNK